MKKKTITVNDIMQQNYIYELSAPPGEKFSPDFRPELSPKELLAIGIFGGKYMTDCREEFPAEWYTHALLCPEYHDPSLNCFGVNASLTLSAWRKNGWICEDDPRGWFQWYCRYYMGRRLPEEDQRQIKRWRAITRHVGAIRKNCFPGDVDCRKKQRQALLHWAIDSRKI